LKSIDFQQTTSPLKEDDSLDLDKDLHGFGAKPPKDIEIKKIQSELQAKESRIKQRRGTEGNPLHSFADHVSGEQEQ